MESTLYAATYHGSLTEYHGPVMVTLDWATMDREGPEFGARYIAYTPDNTRLNGVRAASLTIA